MRFIIIALIISVGAGFVYEKYKSGNVNLDNITGKVKEAGSSIINEAEKAIGDIKENGIDTGKILENNQTVIESAKNIANESMTQILNSVNLKEVDLPKLEITCEDAKKFAETIKNKEGLSGTSADEFFSMYNILKNNGANDALIDQFIESRFCNKQ